MSRRIVSLALLASLALYGAVIASHSPQQALECLSDSDCQTLEDEPSFDCTVHGNNRCNPLPDLEDKR